MARLVTLSNFRFLESQIFTLILVWPSPSGVANRSDIDICENQDFSEFIGCTYILGDVPLLLNFVSITLF